MARQAADLFSRSSTLTFGRRGDEWNRESFVKSEKEFDALAVVYERLGAIAEVNGAVELGVGFDQRWRHSKRIIEVGQRGAGKRLRVSSTAWAAAWTAVRCFALRARERPCI